MSRPLGSIFLYRTDRGRLDRLEATAQDKGKSPAKMLDKIIDDWMSGYVVAPDVPKEKEEDDGIPWYLK